MYIGLHVKHPLFFNEPWNFSSVSKSTQISNFMKIHPVGAGLLQADRGTDGQTWRR